MQDIANAAGVGKATVSLALRNDPRLRMETRRRIQEIARKMEYRPNPTVANLMAQLRASQTPKYQAAIACINASRDKNLLKGVSTFREWTTGCATRATQLGYSLDDFWLFDPELTPQRFIKIFQSRGIRGLMLAAIHEHATLPPQFDDLWTHFACVVVGLRPTRPAMHFACNDQFSTATQGVNELLRLGYKRPGLVLSEEVDGLVDHRFSAGFWIGQSSIHKDNHIPKFPFTKNARMPFKAWFERHKPDSIVCIHEEIKEWLAAMRVRVPQDVGLIHLDRTPNLAEWAGMNQHNDMVGGAAIDLVVGQLHRNECGIPEFPKCVMIESTWVEGKTVKRKKLKY